MWMKVQEQYKGKLLIKNIKSTDWKEKKSSVFDLFSYLLPVLFNSLFI